MVPSDNIFNIYYDIGRALPFEVQRFPKDATDWYKNQSVLVTEIHTRGKYGEALGFYLRKGERAETNVKNFLVNWQALMRVHRELRNQAPTNTQPESAE